MFVKTESITATQRGFCQHFQRLDFPCCISVLLWVSKWRQEGSVKESKPQGRPFSAPTPDSLKWVETPLQSPCRSAQWQALALHFNKRSVRQIFQKDLHYHPYNVQVAQDLSEWDTVS
jgi:hypothetical protein